MTVHMGPRYSDKQVCASLELAMEALMNDDAKVKSDKDPTTGWRSNEHCEAYLVLRWLFSHHYDGPPDGEAWSGGFAENH